jgi:hypothetical protein
VQVPHFTFGGTFGGGGHRRTSILQPAGPTVKQPQVGGGVTKVPVVKSPVTKKPVVKPKRIIKVPVVKQPVTKTPRVPVSKPGKK